MQILHCTGKLRKEMGLKNSDLTEAETEPSFLGSWHANLIYAKRKKAVLFVDDKTLFNFIAINLKRNEIKDLSNIFRENLYQTLTLEGFSAEKIKKTMAEYETIQYDKTRNRSVLGSMNDYAFHYKYHIQNGEFLPDIIHKLNRMPMGALKYAYPIDELRKALSK